MSSFEIGAFQSRNETSSLACLFTSDLLRLEDSHELNNTEDQNIDTECEKDHDDNDKFCVVMRQINDNSYWQESLKEISKYAYVVKECKLHVRRIVEKQICLFAIVWIKCQTEFSSTSSKKVSTNERQFRKRFIKYALHKSPDYNTYVADHLRLAFDLVKIFIFSVSFLFQLIVSLLFPDCRLDYYFCQILRM